jgi:hypothetical protein
MLLRYRLRVVSLLISGAFAAGCSSSPISRIDANSALYHSWPLDVQEAVLDGRVEKGMTPDMVRMSAGKPTQVTSRVGKNGAQQEVWIYRKGGGGGMLSNTGVAVGVGGVNVGGSPGGGSGMPAEEHEVVFDNGVVVSTDYVK